MMGMMGFENLFGGFAGPAMNVPGPFNTTMWPNGMPMMQPGMGLGLMNTSGPLLGSDMPLTSGMTSGVAGAGTPLPTSDLLNFPSANIEGDWSYWENLVSQIQVRNGATS